MKSVAPGLIFLAIVAHTASAQAPTLDDFALGFSVRDEKRGGVWELNLPEAVYRKAVRTDLGDIRVFNNAGEIVPHVLRHPGSKRGQVPQPLPVPFYPLITRNEQERQRQSTRITTDEEGTLIDTVRTAASSGGPGSTSAYVLDTSELENPPVSLELTWKSPRDLDFVASVDVVAGDDLSRWSTLAQSATLAHLRSDGKLLIHNKIDLPPLKARYLRISWPETLSEIVLTDVTANFRALAKPPPVHWLELSGRRNVEDEDVIEFDSQGHWPADRARLNFPSSNSAARVRISSASERDGEWRTRHSGLSYSIVREGKSLTSEPVSFTLTSDRYWQVRSLNRDHPWGSELPTLSLGWIPHVLTFVAEGDPPYTVAFGNVAAAATESPVSTLLEGIDSDQARGLIVAVTPSAIFELGGESRLRHPEEPFPIKTLLLWVVLLGGVVMLAWIVRSLYRQMSPRSR